MANLLIVDDELGMRQFLTHLFQREGHAVRSAENGREAMELLRTAPADLIVSDVRMPDMNGIELLRAARELLPDVEVVMMTAFANVDSAREAFLLGAYDFVQKPFDNDLLKETVARALEKISLVKEKDALLEENKALIQGQRQTQQHHRQVREDAGTLPDDRNGGAGAVNGARHRRLWNGKGTCRARYP
jgi:two-component system response regulator PilR (NtrC family)